MPVGIGWDARSRQVVTLPTKHVGGGVPLDAIEAENAILFVPEIPFHLIDNADLDPIQLGRAYGMRTAALVHDLIPIKRAWEYRPEQLSFYQRYYRQFAIADLVIATTNYVASDLVAYLQEEGLRVPPIQVINLPAALPSVERRRTLPGARELNDPLNLITVTTWEPRKNILGLLRALRLASNGLEAPLNLELVGRRGLFPYYDEEILELVRVLPTVTVRGTIHDSELVELFEACHASVYPSVEEGFGMPIGESLWMGRPCLCHMASSMAEFAPGGGVELVDMADEREIAKVLRRWAEATGVLRLLAGEIIERPLRDWSSFAADVARTIGHKI